MPSTDRRLSKLEEHGGFNFVKWLVSRGIPLPRAHELLTADGIDMEAVTDEELDRISGDGIEIDGTFIEWGQISDEELDALIDDADPYRVLERLVDA